ncbi:DNA-binding transcriptional ArsR family regulator [Kitasatospora sp. MAP12-15]|uniref:ArsR/SmtB family transcription factor n=1 Tax=unclassified Kitasatospora TaxID=2633591 RepID=UPI002474F045|nr:winged helix-turn-helix domain-containing protein [Kitasatospora sp. MAP12-44]MDH6111506.1 DNA-binding transcriptional ArsR family regulator [Kitasatospora sp. MAP12-44]
MPDDSSPIGADDELVISDSEQLRAVSNVVRHRILGILRDQPATITQVAAKLGIAKGSASYHVRLLERAGMVAVVRTRKVRGVTERYYERTARVIRLPAPAQGEPDVLMRHAVADLEAAPVGPLRTVRLHHARLSDAAYAEFTARVEALLDELRAVSDPEQPAVTLALAFFRPQDTNRPQDRT